MPKTLADYLGKPRHRGKVRDTYDLGNGYLLVHTTPRTSALNFKLPQCDVPNKGKVLSGITAMWHELFVEHGICDTHIVAYGRKVRKYLPKALLENEELASQVESEALIVHHCDMVLVEGIVRNFLAGSAYEYVQKHGTLFFDQPVPADIQLAGQFDYPRFTPTDKSETDDPISVEEAEHRCPGIGNICLGINEFAFRVAAARGITLADTKFELGRRISDGKLVLADEFLTTESSRYWLSEDYASTQSGKMPPSHDKDPIRNWIRAEAKNAGITLDSGNPEHHEFVASLPRPDAVIDQVAASYDLIYKMLVAS